MLKHWIDLPEHDVRMMLIALIGHEFGLEPEKRIPEIRESRKNFTNYIADNCQVDKEDIVIDLGSGCGFGTYWLAQRAKHVHGCDISPSYIKFASKECSSLKNVSFHLIESRHLDFLEKDSVDVICSSSVFIHLNLYDIFWYFNEFKRVVKPGGRIWVDVADSESLDLAEPNRNGEFFLRHAESYNEDPLSLAGLMNWNSLQSVINMADHFSFENTYKRAGGELLFIKRQSTRRHDHLRTAETDLTGNYDYERLIKEEKRNYSNIEVTENLKEGGVHAHNAWQYYWKDIATRLSASPVSDLPEFLKQRFSSQGRPIKVISLGSGYCGHELDLARRMSVPYKITCTDINEAILAPAKKIALEENLSMDFRISDLNFIDIEPGGYDLIFAHASLHHVINLERLFDQIRAGLSERGVFHLVEVLGMNRKLIWDENEQFANTLLDALPKEITHGIRLKVPFETDGMEGVRQEDILPLLYQNFQPIFELRHGAFMRFICTHGDLGCSLDPIQPHAKQALDFLMECDASAVRHGILRPLEIWGVYEAVRN